MKINVALSAGIVLLSFAKADAALTVVVLDQDTNNGIEANVTLSQLGPPPQSLPLGPTEEDGTLTNDQATCRLGDTLSIHPIDTDYPQPISPTSCNRPKVILKLRSLARTAHIEHVSAQAEANNNFAVAAQAANELNASQPDPNTEKHIYEDTAKALGLSADQATVIDPQQGKAVPSPTLISAVKKYQADNNLKVTGQINSPTLASLSNGPASTNVIFRPTSTRGSH